METPDLVHGRLPDPTVKLKDALPSQTTTISFLKFVPNHVGTNAPSLKGQLIRLQLLQSRKEAVQIAVNYLYTRALFGPVCFWRAIPDFVARILTMGL
jgi:hypothetical protein